MPQVYLRVLSDTNCQLSGHQYFGDTLPDVFRLSRRLQATLGEMAEKIRTCVRNCALLLVSLFAIPTASLFSSDGENGSLDAARHNYALNFFSVETHVSFAKALYDSGQRLQAFYVLETARREHFPQLEFDRAFRKIFRGDSFDNTAERESALLATLAKSPNDYDALVKLADIHISRGEFEKALPLLERASRIRPDDYSPVEALTAIYERTGREAKAKSTRWLWVSAHPDSVEAYTTQIEKSQPERGLALVEEALKRYPDSAVLHYDHAALLHKTGDAKTAELEFKRAGELEPNSALIEGWMARFYLKSMNDEPRAFDHYLKAYFLDPDFYDSEFAEQRILKLARGLAVKALEKGAPPEGQRDTLLEELRPAVMGQVLEALEHSWDPEALSMVVDMLHEDDEQNRWNAMQLVAQHGGPGFDKKLTQLLDDPDERTRGMAGYIAVKRWNKRAFPILEKRLDDPAVLIRFDAISALAMDGGNAGREIVQRYAQSGKEQDSHLREIIPKILEEQKAKLATSTHPTR